MKHIFYLITIIPLMFELLNVYNPKRYNRFMNQFKKDKKKSWDKWTKNQKNISVLMLFYIMWSFVGLFSSQWLTFLVLIFISFIPKKGVYMRFIDSFITVLILLFIIINRYHLDINLYEYFIK